MVDTSERYRDEINRQIDEIGRFPWWLEHWESAAVAFLWVCIGLFVLCSVVRGQETYSIKGTIEITGDQVVLTKNGDPDSPDPDPQRDLKVFLGGIQRATEMQGALDNTVQWKGKQIQWPGGFAIEVGGISQFNSLMAKAAELKRPVYVSLTTSMATNDAIDAVTSSPHNALILGGEVEDFSGNSWTKAKFESLVAKASWPVYAFARMYRETVPNHPRRSDMNYIHYAAGTQWRTNLRRVPFEPRSDRLAQMQRWVRSKEGNGASLHLTGFGQTWQKGTWDKERQAIGPSMSQVTWMLMLAEKSCDNAMFWGTRQARGDELLLTWDRNPRLWKNLVVATDHFLRDEVIDFLPGGDAKLIEFVP